MPASIAEHGPYDRGSGPIVACLDIARHEFGDEVAGSTRIPPVVSDEDAALGGVSECRSKRIGANRTWIPEMLPRKLGAK